MKCLLAVAATLALVPVIGPGSASAGGGCHGTNVPDARGVAVTINDLCFDPLVLRVARGTTVRWTNEDQTAHNITGAAFQWSSNGEDLRYGDTISFRFNDDGVFPYACTIHPGMIAAVVVGTGVRPAGEPMNMSTAVRQIGDIVNRPKSTPTPETDTAEPATAQPAESPSAAAVVATVPQPPSAQPRPVAAAPAASTSANHGGLLVAGFALIGALVLAGVAFLARRSPPRRELVG